MSCLEKCLSHVETFNSELKVGIQNILFKPNYLFLKEVSYMFRLKRSHHRADCQNKKEKLQLRGYEISNLTL